MKNFQIKLDKCLSTLLAKHSKIGFNLLVAVDFIGEVHVLELIHLGVVVVLAAFVIGALR